MSKTDFHISRQLYADLIEAYKKVCGTCWSQQEAYEKMVKQPAPRYYLSPKQAFQVISKMVKGDFEMVNLFYPRRRRMYYSLYDTTCKLMEKPTFCGKSLWYIMQYAVLEPAPEFFIGTQRARQVRRWLKSGVITPEGTIDDTKIKCFARTREAKRKQKEERERWMSGQMLEEIEETKR